MGMLLRFVIANLLLFALYTAVTVLCLSSIIGNEDIRGLERLAAIVATGRLLGMSAIPVFCAVNWWLLRLRNRVYRILLGIGLGLLACALAYAPYAWIVLKFLSLGASQ